MDHKLTPETKLQAIGMIKALNEQGQIDAMEFTLAWNHVKDAAIDWHEFSYLLDWLHTLGFLEVTGFSRDGMTKYKIVGTK